MHTVHNLLKIGTWDPQDTLNITRQPKIVSDDSNLNIMANKTFVVALLFNDPYTMLKEVVSLKKMYHL
jgi:hypothetical protein